MDNIKQLYKKIADVARRYNAARVVLYGSRARTDNRENSDIDIAVFEMPKENQGLFASEIEDLPSLLDFDILFVNAGTDKNLLKNIEKDGVVLMDKFNEKYEKFEHAVLRLSQAIDEYKANKSDTVRDGAIQRFEFCTELAWKTLREYLLQQGYIDINSPKSVMKKAYADGLISNQNLWLDLLAARNTTSHIYDEDNAAAVFSDIKTRFLPAFKELREKLSK
ncbi:MAG: HI0074 family nucleotidyltransferase substrate-binding subunit [Clostridiales bacterium]|nr:HI0074 family nucleotidyltransferase substrate-binding subunit [Clostridiales bacterium]